MSSKKVSKPFEENFQELNSISLSLQDQEEMRRWLHKKIQQPTFFSRFRSIVPATATIAVLTIAFFMFTTSEGTLKESTFSQGEKSSSSSAAIDVKEQETISRIENLYNLTLENYQSAENLKGTTAFRELQSILSTKDIRPSMFVKMPIQETRSAPAYIFWEDERGSFLYTIEHNNKEWNVRTLTHINESGTKEVTDIAIDFKHIDSILKGYAVNMSASDEYQASSIDNGSMEMIIDENKTITIDVSDQQIKINSFDKEFKLDFKNKPLFNKLVGTEASSLGFLEVVEEQGISTYVIDHKQNNILKLENHASTPIYDTVHKVYYVVAGDAGKEYVTTFKDGQVQPRITSKHHNIVSIIPSGNGKYVDYLVETTEPNSYKLMRYSLETNKETELLNLNMQEMKYLVHQYLNQPLSEISNRLVHELY
ncbi:hypothetical protein JOC85_002592 [Bacillus mesophilus]|uniref:Uncharacterized protein n=1 Tax=Bacillus mesophilus TaxID=1808955 RepID=A0A6M0Q844_9BACI|nr:hypothetical protein [Bacillus mesophilus]MBM7661789.1 hypothetical protein [Bacillus mesophilus]NEY72447.1 hypothetical protein [Bacillus mesophilus]